MDRKFWFGLVFFICLVFVALWKFWAWIFWKILNLRKEQQVFNLIGKSRFIEITGPSGKGKSWLLSHLFKHLQGVKFTNMPTPQGLNTLTKETFEVHMSGKWAKPHRFYYFLDDVTKFQKWGKKNFQKEGWRQLKEYISQSGKLGGTFIWTNNGSEGEPAPCFKVSKNEQWKVINHISFMSYSLLIVKKSWWYTFIPINNKEIESFYDPHWNVPRDYQKNLLSYLDESMKSEELGNIISVVSEQKSNKDWIKNIEVKWKEILKYNHFRALEEAAQAKKKKAFSEAQKRLKRYGLRTTPLTFEELEKLEKEDKRKKAKKQADDPKQPLTKNEAADEFAAENEDMQNNSPVKEEEYEKSPKKKAKNRK